MTKKQEILMQYSKDMVIPDMSQIDEENRPFIRDFLLILKDKKKLTYEDMAEASGASPSTICRFLTAVKKENGCNVYVAGAIARLTGFSLDDYFGIKKEQMTTADLHKMDLLEIELNHMKEKYEIVEKDKHNLITILYALIIAIVFAMVDLFMPEIGTTAGSFALLWLFIGVISIYGIIVHLLLRKGKGR